MWQGGVKDNCFEKGGMESNKSVFYKTNNKISFIMFLPWQCVNAKSSGLCLAQASRGGEEYLQDQTVDELFNKNRLQQQAGTFGPKKKNLWTKKKEPVDSSWKWQSPRFEPRSPQKSLLLFIVSFVVMAIVKRIYFSKSATFWWWDRFKVTGSCVFIDSKENCEVPFVPRRLFSCIFQTLFTFPRP